MSKRVKVKWNDVIEIKNGRSQKAVEDTQGQYPIYGSGGVMGYANDYICDEDCVIIGRKGTINKPIYVEEKFWNVDTAFGLSAKKEKLFPKFLFYFCVNFDFEKLNKTVTIPSLTKSNLLDIQMLLPPIETQKQIAETLDTTVELLTMRKQHLVELDNLIKSIFYDMFGDPVTNEKGWNVSTLDDVCEKITDGTHQTPEYSDSGYVFLSSKNVTSGYIDWNDVKYIPDDLHKELYKRLKPKKNDILLAKNGTTGVAAIVDRDCIFDIYVSLALLRPISTINPVYLLKAINSDACKYQFDMNLKGIGVPNLHLNMIKKVKILVPKIELQNQFAHIVAKIEEQKALVKKAIDETQYLFDSLMSEYFD